MPEGFYAIEIEIDLRELMVRMGKRRRLCYAQLTADNPRRKRNILRFMHIQLPCHNVIISADYQSPPCMLRRHR